MVKQKILLPRRSPAQHVLFLTCVSAFLAHMVQGQKAVEPQQQQPPSFCLSQNPLIGVLKQHKVKVFGDPVPSNSQICASEWKQHQTCCQQKSLLNYAEKDIKLLRRTLDGVKQNAASLLGFIKENKKLIFEALKKKQIRNKKQFVQEFKDELNAFQTSISPVLHKKKQARESMNDCFHRIQEIKTNSLCYTCSGRSAHFFLKGLALMGVDDCRKTVTKCSNTWHNSIKLVDAMDFARRLHRKLSQIIPDEEIMTINVKNLEKLQNWIGSHHIRQAIKECDDSIDSCSDSSAKSLCEAFISLRPKDFLSKVGNAMTSKAHKPATTANTTQTSAAPVTNKPKTSPVSTIWAIGRSRLLTGEIQNKEQSICFDIRQDIQVVKCNQTHTGSVPMQLSGSILSANVDSSSQPTLLATSNLAEEVQP